MLNICEEQINLEREILFKLKETKKYVDEKFKGVNVDDINALMSVLSLLSNSHQHKLSELEILYDNSVNALMNKS